MKKRKFSGALATPITIRTRSVTILTDTPEEREKIAKHNGSEALRSVAESLEKIDLLCKEFGVSIDPDPHTKFIMLTLALAREYVPGFRIKNLSISRSRGRIKEWDTLKYMQLIADVEGVKREKQQSDSSACSILATAPRFAGRWRKYGARTLKNRLVEARQVDKNILYKLLDHEFFKDTNHREQAIVAL